MRRTRGVTLIETIVSITLLIILLSIGSLGYNFFNKINKELKNEAIISEITDLIIYGKSYCSNYETSGKIVFNNSDENREIRFTVNGVRIATINNFSDLYFVKDDGSKIEEAFWLDINNTGVATPMTITLMNKENEKHKITIAVGSNRVRYRGGS